MLIVPLLVAGCGWFGTVRDPQAAQAKADLDKGLALYESRQFEAAQKTLLHANARRDKLAPDRQKVLDAHLAKIGEPIRQQAADMEAFDKGRKAHQAGDLAGALAHLKQAENSKYVPQQVTKAARAERALIEQKQARAAEAAGLASAAAKPAPATKPSVPAAAKPAPATKPSVLAVAKPTPVPAAKPPVLAVAKPAPAAPPAGGPATQPAGGLTQVAAEAQAAKIKWADEAIAKGDAALAASDVDGAIGWYEKAVAAGPAGYERARVKLEFARNLVARTDSLRAIGQLEQQRQVQKQELLVRYNQAIQRARELLQTARRLEEFDQAADQARSAQMLVTTGKGLFTGAEFAKMRTETEQLLSFIADSKEKWEQRLVRQQALAIQENIRKREEDVKRQLREKIATLKTRARTLREEQKYTQAVEVLGQILKLDPNDAWAAEWHASLRQFAQLQDARNARDTGLSEETKQLVGIRWAQVPWYELLTYPEDWAEITLKRKPFGAGEAVESEANRAVRKRLQQNLPRLEFSGIPLSDVIQFLRDVSNTSIFVKWGALTTAGIDKSTPVNVKLTNVTLEKALRTILADVGGVTQLGFLVDEGVITISTKDDLSKDTITRVYDIRDLIIRVPNFVGPDIDIQSATNNQQGAGNNNAGTTGGGGIFGGTGTTGTTTGGNNQEEPTPTRKELIDSILKLIRGTIATDTWRDNSGTIGSLAELNGQLVVTQTAENHRSLLDLLNQLREARALQINIESRFVTVNSGFLNHIGIDLDFYFNIGSSMQRQVDATTGGWATDPLTGARLLTPGGGTDLAQWAGRRSYSNRYTSIPVRLGSYDFAGPQQTGVGNNIGGAASGSGLNISGAFLDDIQVDFVLAATQAHQATRTLTAPRVTIFNGQRAYVTVARQLAYVSGARPIVSENVAIYEPIVNTVATGSVLDVEGTVSADRRYVTLTMRPTVSSVNGFTEYWGQLDADGNPVPGSGLIQLPDLTIQKLECTVSVPDGGTLLLGGQRLAGEAEREMGVPIISKIPVLNRAFSNRSIVRDEQTLLIMVKPEIIIQREYEEAAFPP